MATRQTTGRPDRPEDDPQLLDADTMLRLVFVEVADALPGGRKQMGLHAVRVKKAQTGTYTPRPSDLLMLATRGGNAARIALALHALADAVMTAGACDGAGDDVPAIVASYADAQREVGEAMAAGAEWIGAPTCLTTERAALKEYSEAVAALSRVPRLIGRRRFQRAASRTTPLGRVEVMRS